MRKLLLILIFSTLAGCSFQGTGKKAVPPKAVYFVHGQGELSPGDVQAHPEVVVVQTFDELKKYASQKIALWIDKSATPFDSEEEQWINAAPQTYYPIVLIGMSDTLHAFRDLLRLHGFQGPAGIYPGFGAPGFSVIQWEATNQPDVQNVTFLHGFDQKPTVPSILEVTNDLLIGKIRPTPISTVPKALIEIPTSAARPVILYDEEPKNGFPNDAAKINALYLPIRNNILTLDVAYRGNCKEHTFELYAWTAFLQSNPPQGVLYLSHDAHADTCTENVEQELSFDLSPLNVERNDPSEHPLLLRIYEPEGGAFAKEPFVPLPEWP